MKRATHVHKYEYGIHKWILLLALLPPPAHTQVCLSSILLPYSPPPPYKYVRVRRRSLIIVFLSTHTQFLHITFPDGTQGGGGVGELGVWKVTNQKSPL